MGAEAGRVQHQPDLAEILSGFRTGPGGAQEFFGVTPDMCTLGKALGGGMPLSAFAGRREIMACVSPLGLAMHSGTYNAHLTAIAAALAFLDEITKPDFYPRLKHLGDRLYRGLRDIFAHRSLPVWVQGVGARFGLLFGLEREPTNYRDVARRNLDRERRFLHACLQRGLYLHPGSPHHGFSSAHSVADVEEMLRIAEDAAHTIGGA